VKDIFIGMAFSALLQLLKSFEPAMITMFRAAFAKLYLAIEQKFSNDPTFARIVSEKKSGD